MKVCNTSPGFCTNQPCHLIYFCLRALSQRRQWHPTPVLLPGKSHGWRSLVGCSPWGREESDKTKQLHFHFSLSCIGEGNGNALQCSCLENPRGNGAWWAAVYGVAQSQTQLKRLSSSSSSRALSIRLPELNKLSWWIYRIFYVYIFSRGSTIVSIRFPRKSQLKKLIGCIIALNSAILRFCILFLSTLLMSLSGNELSCQAQWPSKEQGYFYFKLKTHI